MDTNQIIESITKLNELDLQEVIEAIEGYAQRNNMNHLIRSYSDDDYDEIRHELSEAEYKIESLKRELSSVNRKIDEVKNILD